MLTDTERRAIKKLRSYMRLESAALHFTPEQLATMTKPGPNDGPDRCFASQRDTECMREAMRLWRDSWVEPLIDALLDTTGGSISGYNNRNEAMRGLSR